MLHMDMLQKKTVICINLEKVPVKRNSVDFFFALNSPWCLFAYGQQQETITVVI